jgi:hypothetical protein
MIVRRYVKLGLANEETKTKLDDFDEVYICVINYEDALEGNAATSKLQRFYYGCNRQYKR